ncbi:hypothetical protein CBER1_10131 [Cercospora berteroae]|uniref:Uncharacterized protein n=1 Tax=Cercospora berteroae TaxID=357750 RepID=A0A2S6CKC7_9PEZI|nr:hypothetical protein CBER1_10131 [Cercospora berteroae]
MVSKTMPPTLQQPTDLPMGDVDDVAALQTGLARLPQELYDLIYDLTFTANAAVRMFFKDRGADEDDYIIPRVSSDGPLGFLPCHTTRNQRLPRNLTQMDRTSRFKYARSFYGQNSIIVVCGHLGLTKLLSTMQSDHVPLLRVYFRDLWGVEPNEARSRRVWVHLKGCYPSHLPEIVQFPGLEEARVRP